MQRFTNHTQTKLPQRRLYLTYLLLLSSQTGTIQSYRPNKYFRWMGG